MAKSSRVIVPAPQKQSGPRPNKATPGRVLKVGKLPVFEATIGNQRFLYCAVSPTPKPLGEITDLSAQDYAEDHNMVIVNRSRANPDAVKALRKAWAIARVEIRKQQQTLSEQRTAVHSRKTPRPK